MINDAIPVTITATLITATERAYKVTQDEDYHGGNSGYIAAWLPRSLCAEHYDDRHYDTECEFTVPQWIAEKRNLEVD